MALTRLHLYDFDGTLFRSPAPPPGWSDAAGWYDDPVSLSEPCVPTFPPATWWITSTLQSAKKSIQDQSVYAVLATGRLELTFRDRLDELLQAKRLDFDEVHLRPHGRTADFKIKLMREILAANPEITFVDVWEDQERNMAVYRSFLQGQGLAARIHPVKFKPVTVRCRPPSAARVASAWRSR